MEDQYGAEQMEKIGIALPLEDGSVKLVYFDEATESIISVDITGEADYRKVMFNEGQEPDLKKVIKFMH
jgi:hypothetical protein